MKRVLVIVPGTWNDENLALRRAQLDMVDLDPQIDFEFKPVKANPAWFDSHHDWLLQDVAVLEAGIEAQADGYHAVCIDTVSDAGLNALRSILDIPVVGAGKASYLAALMIGTQFSILTWWDAWKGMYEKSLQEYGLAHKCVSIRSIGVRPDLQNYLGGKEDQLLPLLLDQAQSCIEEDGADVVCLGSTSMYQAHEHLVENLGAPVINPGPVAYKMVEVLLGVDLTHSRLAYRKPDVPQNDVVHAMVDAAAAAQKTLG